MSYIVKNFFDGKNQDSLSKDYIDIFDPKTKTTIRNLRIREDTAKYLLNLDVHSAYYDPKSKIIVYQ